MAFSGVKGRFETIKTKYGFDVIIDFAHTPNALIRVLSTIAGLGNGRVIHVFGSAGLRDTAKRPMMGAASAKYADITVLTEEDYRTEDVNKIIEQIEQGYRQTVKSMKTDNKQLFKIPSRKEAVEHAITLAKKGDIVVLTGKGHEKSLCRGKKEYPWSDQEAVEQALNKLS
jgi:UDP-N-acetylmuramoyl-L-alanyl-D-glutamate--2,6-diaminopimelate ligase